MQTPRHPLALASLACLDFLLTSAATADAP
jgi:hypothetical protein